MQRTSAATRSKAVALAYEPARFSAQRPKLHHKVMARHPLENVVNRVGSHMRAIFDSFFPRVGADFPRAKKSLRMAPPRVRSLAASRIFQRPPDPLSTRGRSPTTAWQARDHRVPVPR